MSHYPDGFDAELLNEGPEIDNSELDELCDKAEASLSSFTVESVVTTEDDMVRNLAYDMDAKIALLVDDCEGIYLDAAFDYRDGLKNRWPKLHALLEAL